MNIYDTYAECKKNHPEDKVYYATGVGFAPGSLRRKMGLWRGTNPADYLMSLKEFFEAGHEFVDGDCYLSQDGEIITIGAEENATISNEHMEGDKNRFVLSAKALEEKVELVEEIIYGSYWNGEGLPTFGCYVTVRYKFDSKQEIRKGLVLYASDNHCILNIAGNECYFKMSEYTYEKPETPEQKKEREELESAYDLYVCWAGDEPCHQTIDHFRDTQFHKDFLRVVNKTGYRKQE